MHGLAVYGKEGLLLAQDLSLKNSADSYLCFGLTLLHSVTSFSSIDDLLYLCTKLFILFNLTQTRFSRSTDLLMCLSRETSIIRADVLILVKLIDLVNSVRIFLSQTTLLSWLTYLLLLRNFFSGFRLELMYISIIKSIRSSLTYLHGFQLLLLLSYSSQ